jgi:glycosyltransferase involved in cell wall biosynthesis
MACGFEGTAMRIILSAYACVPGRGGEHGIGWNWVRETARLHEVRVLTSGEGRKEIEAQLAQEPIPAARFLFIDVPGGPMLLKIGTVGRLLHYYAWQLLAYFEARKFHRQERIDGVHHVTYGMYSTPVFLAALGLPFLWGPVGGGESAPPALWLALGARGALWECLRAAVRRLQEVDPFVRFTARRATRAYATTEETRQRMCRLGCRSISVQPVAVLSIEEIGELSRIPDRHAPPFRLLSLGRLVGWKGFEFGIRAFALFRRKFPESEYHLVGDGPARKRLERTARRLGLAGSVVFHGKLPRRQALETLAESDILMHPSLHDSGGWACVEAMAAGRPVLCLKRGGPSLLVGDDAGIRIPAGSTEQVVRDLAAALERLALDPLLRCRMGEAARRRVRDDLNWERVADRVFGSQEGAGAA